MTSHLVLRFRGLSSSDPFSPCVRCWSTVGVLALPSVTSVAVADGPRMQTIRHVRLLRAGHDVDMKWRERAVRGIRRPRVRRQRLRDTADAPAGSRKAGPVTMNGNPVNNALHSTAGLACTRSA